MVLIGQGKGPEGMAWDDVAVIQQDEARQGRAGQGRAGQGRASYDMLVRQQPGVGRLCWLALLPCLCLRSLVALWDVEPPPRPAPSTYSGLHHATAAEQGT